MKRKKLYYKTDFKIWERCECGFGAPFYFIYFTNNPRCGVVASYDGREYHGCRLMEDGRLCVAFDDHGLGLGVLRVERRFYLSDADYASGVCDEVFPPIPVTCEDGDEQYNLYLSLDGALSELNASSVVPPYFIKGEDAKINGVNSIEIVGEAVKQEGDRLTIDAYSKSTVDDLLGDKATKQELQNTAQGLGQSISSVGALAESAKETAENAKNTTDGFSAIALDAQGKAIEAKQTSEEAKQIALGANRSITFATYKELVQTLEGGSGVFEFIYGAKAKVGQNIYIAALNVPDCWIAEVDEEGRLTSSEFDKESPTFDDDIANLLVSENGLVVNTWIRLRALETQKVDLTEYDKEINDLKTKKQDTLVSGENIKTINGKSLLGSGNLEIEGLSDDDKSTINNLIELYEYTRLQAESNDFDTLPLLCGQPMILFGKGTPYRNIVPDNWRQYDIETGEGYNWNGLPSALGQQYINTSVTSGGRYIAVYDGYCSLKWVNF